MTTVANIRSADSSHWYYPDGKPCFEIAKKDGSGMRRPDLRDARKLNLVPSVTNILRVLHKEALEAWKIEQAVLAVITTPRLPSEADDAFVKRVLQTQKIHEEEMERARNKGTEIHDAMSLLAREGACPSEIAPWVLPAFNEVAKAGAILTTEQIVGGEGYAGTLDMVQQFAPDHYDIVDWKSSGTLPEKESWPEHQLQLAAYAAAYRKQIEPTIKLTTTNVYISTKECGKFVIFNNPSWVETYEGGFKPLIRYWQWVKRYYPQ